MAMKIRGRSDFTFLTTQNAATVLSSVRSTVRDLQGEDPRVLSAEVVMASEDARQFEILLVLAVDGYNAGESIMLHFQDRLIAALEDEAPVAMATELVPA